MPIQLTISGSGGHLGHSGVSQKPGAGFNLFLEKWKFPVKGTAHLLTEGPNAAITVDLRATGRKWALSYLLGAASSLHRPPSASLFSLLQQQPSPQVASRSLKGTLAEFKQPKVACRESLSSLCLLPRWQKHQVSPGKPPQALTSNTHLVYCWNMETLGQSGGRNVLGLSLPTHKMRTKTPTHRLWGRSSR